MSAVPGESERRKAATNRSIPSSARMEDFRSLVQAAESKVSNSRSTLRFNARPIIPTCEEHPEWFRNRPDGTIQYAENPPKKYQDIYPFDFET